MAVRGVEARTLVEAEGRAAASGQADGEEAEAEHGAHGDKRRRVE